VQAISAVSAGGAHSSGRRALARSQAAVRIASVAIVHLTYHDRNTLPSLGGFTLPLSLAHLRCGSWGEEMAKGETVNLDALIEREDFESEEKSLELAGKQGRELYLTSLTREDRLGTLRKPDFQRETSSWSPEIIATFIESVANGDVIPSLIMWRSPTTGKTFIIDGAHRASALVAWIVDDYGDGDLSKAYYGHDLPPQQISAARRTRELVEGRVGKFEELKSFNRSNNAPTAQKQKYAANVVSIPLQVQPVEGDAAAAEKSFKRINQAAVGISREEERLIDNRRYPAGIATRALMRAGAGYEYWSKFEESIRHDIKSTAASIHDQLIKPITDYPLLALDLPAPSRTTASSLNTILDLVEILNASGGRSSAKKAPEPDLDGSETLAHLEQVRRATERVFGSAHKGSLALHPALYCYDNRGKFVGKAFIGAIEFVRDLEKRDKFFEFTAHRKTFEEFLIARPHLMTQIGKTQGSGGRRGVPAVVALYKSLFEGLRYQKSEEEIIKEMQASRALNFLDWAAPVVTNAGDRFSDADKAGIIIKTALDRDLCPECGGRMYIKDRSFDHTDRLIDGGKSTADNGQLTHPYCNSGYKERRLHLARLGTSNVGTA